MKRITALVGAVALMAAVGATSAFAAIDSVSGQMEQIAPPASVEEGALENNDLIRAFDEKQDHVLAAPLAVDITSAGTYDDPADLTPGTIPSGTVVDSHFLHFDTVNSSVREREGTVTLDGDILGIIITRTNLNNSDAEAGSPTTVYPVGNEVNQRELDIEGDFDFVVQPDMRTVTMHGRVTSGVDHVRIVTQGNQPPDCSNVTASPNRLWPPNHKFHLVTLSGGTDPDGDIVTLTITGVTQDEPVDGLGDGHHAPDAKTGTAPNNVYLRAERSGLGDGRVYRIAFTGSDGNGGTCTGTATVGVPHDRGGQATPVDSGETYNSFG